MKSPNPPVDDTEPTKVASSPELAAKPTCAENEVATDNQENAPRTPVAPLVKAGDTIGGYKLMEKLGEGGMGTVFVAEDIALHRMVALKVMKPEITARESSRQRFFREARAAARIEHDNIVPIYQVGEEKGIPFLAMALLKGKSLGQYLRENPRPDLQFTLAIAHDVADGLAAAHDKGLMHRDVKPDNIWIEPLPKTGGSRAKILDFGLARPREGNQQVVTHRGAVLGTPAYMSPEQARGGDVDHRADLFSLGIVLYQMATGARPFNGRDAVQMLASLTLDQPTEPVRLNPSLPLDLSRLIMRMLEKDPARRTQKASDVSKVLKSLQPQNAVVVATSVSSKSKSKVKSKSKKKKEANPWKNIEDSDATHVDNGGGNPLNDKRKSDSKGSRPIVSLSGSSVNVQGQAPATGSRHVLPWVIAGGMAVIAAIAAAVMFMGGR